MSESEEIHAHNQRVSESHITLAKMLNESISEYTKRRFDESPLDQALTITAFGEAILSIVRLVALPDDYTDLTVDAYMTAQQAEVIRNKNAIAHEENQAEIFAAGFVLAPTGAAFVSSGVGKAAHSYLNTYKVEGAE